MTNTTDELKCPKCGKPLSKPRDSDADVYWIDEYRDCNNEECDVGSVYLRYRS